MSTVSCKIPSVSYFSITSGGDNGACLASGGMSESKRAVREYEVHGIEMPERLARWNHLSGLGMGFAPTPVRSGKSNHGVSGGGG